jgi:GrxC family glutaredoxin
MITVYSKTYCPFCDSAKQLLSSLNLDYEVVDITNDPETAQKISQKSGMMTVPQIFINEKCIGGYTELEKLARENKLKELIEQNDKN